MTREELLQLLQERGLSDDEIAALLKETLDTISKDDYDADKKEEEHLNEDDEKKKAADLLGVEL